MIGHRHNWIQRLAALALLFCLPALLSAEVVLQYFNTSWRDLADKMPELVEVGYTALWLPPPTKGSGGLSVGYDLWDPHDLGGKDQRNSVRTRYGTEADLLYLIGVAHRFGLRVYFDNIMNHRAFDVPGFNAFTPIDVYPGLVPEDFHLRVTEEGFYRKWDNIANWSDTWQIQYRNFSDLIDIAQESPDNGNFGASEGDHIPKIKFVRDPNNPEYYCFAPDGGGGSVYVGFGTTNITASMLTNSANAYLYEENVNSYLIRAVRWLVAHTYVDGLRLDAVKHVPSYFFGEQYAAGKDSSGAGYLGQAQEQFNLTRGFNDWDNHRDTVFEHDASIGRNDLMMFGEHLGAPPSLIEYIDAGMKLVDSQLHSFLNGNLGQPWGTLSGLQHEGGGGFSWSHSVMYTKSHDDGFAERPELHYAFNLTRRGLPNVYTDGNYQSETLGESGGAFPRHANTAFLGQFSDNRIPNLVYIHNQFSRGTQYGRWGDVDVVAYDRIDKRENGGMNDADGCVLFFVMNDNYANGQYREISTFFPEGSKLWQYSTGGGNFYYTVENDWSGSGNGMIKVITPPGGYFAFSWRNPEASDLWSGPGGKPLTIYENGAETGFVSYERKDGPDGDPGFNPYGVADSDPTDFTYTYSVPRVSSETNLRFVVRVDGSAKDVKIKLDGGVDLNGQNHSGGDPRDFPPGNAGSSDIFHGYEGVDFVHRQYREKFAARNTDDNNVIGSDGAETYQATIGAAGFVVNAGATGRDSDDNTASWIFHDPETTNDVSQDQFWPLPENAAGQEIIFWVKVGYEFEINTMYLYYTTDGVTFPEGAGGAGIGLTRVVGLTHGHEDTWDSTVDWWTGSIPALSNGAVLRYKLGGFKKQNGDTNAIPFVPFFVAFPNDDYNIGNKKSMMGVWQVDGFDAGAATYYPHNDFSFTQTGLDEGFHVLRARAFLERDNRASIYNTFVQPFYYDVMTPTGVVVFPAENDTLQQNEYGVVVRTDRTVTEVWYHIDDSSVANDDAQTGSQEGNGQGTNNLGGFITAWQQASPVSPSLNVNSSFPDEWRFSYRNIPPGGSNATLHVRLLEVSSSSNMTLSDVAGHFTTLIRNVNTEGPPQELFFGWPTADGQFVQAGWEIWLLFSKELGDGLSDAELLDSFLIKIDGVAQGKNLYQIERDIDGTYGKITYALPDLYNGDESVLHHIEVTHEMGGGVTLQASRFVRAEEVDSGPHIDIVQPREFDSDGKALEIFFAASSPPQDRTYVIRVETDMDAKHVWLKFTNSVGETAAFATTTNPLVTPISVANGSQQVIGEEVPISGTVSVVFSNDAVMGAGTIFSNDVMPGTNLRIDSNLVTVSEIVTDTNLVLTGNYMGSSASGLSVSVLPDFERELTVGGSLVIAGNIVGIQSIQSASNLTISVPYAGATDTNVTAYRLDGNPQFEGGRLYWNFRWTNILEGFYTFYAYVNTNAADTTQIHGQQLRHTTVVLRDMVTNDVSDLDDDDDGLYDADETTPIDLPESNAETWESGEVHVWQIYGRTDSLLPDSDADGLPDGLESGWRVPISLAHTDISTDTDGDGFANFRADLDPPFYNTVPDNGCGQQPGAQYCLPEFVFNAGRTDLIHGSMTDPNNADSDYDGLPDGVEDQNRNGWADGDGLSLGASTANPWTDRPGASDWPDGEWDAGWASHPDRETDPNKADTDEDGASDGYGEDLNSNGWVDGDANSNRVHDAGEVWTETDPLNPDTDGDGLPDGWEKQSGLDPLNSGIIGHTNIGTGLVISNLTHGASGNPDLDVIVTGGVTSDYSNVLEFQNGTNPTRSNALDSAGGAGLTVGQGELLGAFPEFDVFESFMDWSRADCTVLDEYEGDGQNNQQGDLYLAWDGWDTSRDIVAFYARDGGDTDGKFYFRVDFHDLQPHAEEQNLDLYVVIDTGNPAAGEMNLPDDVDTITWNRWEVVVAVYQSNTGRVYVDLNAGVNTTDFGQDLFASGVVARDQTTPDGFLEAYYNAELDSVEFSISRQALIDAGWSGFGASNFNYQVYTTKDGTGNNPVGGGDIGGRSDVRDAIFNDFVAEDYWQAQEGLESILKYWIPGTFECGQAKIAMVLHGNQAVEPGSEIQDHINTGTGAGYHRALDTHEVLGQPLSLHITPTLASAIAWAAVDPAAGKPWRDGPAFNARIAALVETNIVYLLGSTFSDHMLPYFTKAYNRDNETLARHTLDTIYDTSIDRGRAVFWTPERLLDADVFDKILDMGYGYTFLDQDTHLWNWFGRTESLVDGAYQMNEIDGVKCFVINKIPSESMFENHDSGVDISLRSLLSRKARSGTQDQVITLFGNWEAFEDNDKADAYDRNLWWLANRPWVRIVSHEQIAAGEVDVWGDDAGDPWGWRPRGSVAAQSKEGHNWLNHATEGNFDNWYVGSGIEEGLENKIFDIRPGTNVADRYGMMFSSGIVLDTWNMIGGITDSNLAWLARATMHASTFQTAFHDEGENDLRRYSIGTYMVPATSSNALAPFAAQAQAQTRMASIYSRVDQWAAVAGSLSTTQAAAEDVDLDGENEYLLYNKRLFALFERVGGHCVGVWVRDVLDGTVAQAAGNFISHPGSENETEGPYSVETNGTVVAHRTSLFKDWWVDVGTLQYVNDVYTFSAVPNGWRARSSDLALEKTITLEATSNALEAQYMLSGWISEKTLFVRHGLSPNLYDLLLYGQSRLSSGTNSGTQYTLAATNYNKTVTAIIDYAGGSHNALYKSDAVDDSPGQGVSFDTLNMRNQAQTEQVEIYGTGSFSFSIAFRQKGSDWNAAKIRLFGTIFSFVFRANLAVL